ncbi:hypothetical protein SNEBB_006127 [Seison nebaliae]|nr:hypothetical protein SNEBB_006127 [Seison nebaliae]
MTNWSITIPCNELIVSDDNEEISGFSTVSSTKRISTNKLELNDQLNKKTNLQNGIDDNDEELNNCQLDGDDVDEEFDNSKSNISPNNNRRFISSDHETTDRSEQFLHFADYFAIVGSVPISGGDTNIQDDNTLPLLRGEVLQRFPKHDWPNLPFPNGIEYFCQPKGWIATTSPQETKFFNTVMTNVSGARYYCAILSFYETFLMKKENRKNNYSKYNGQSTRNSSILIPKCLVIVSRLSCFESFKNCLSMIYALHVEHNHQNGSYTNVYVDEGEIHINQRPSYLLESVVANLLSDVIIPLFGGNVCKFSLAKTDRHILHCQLDSTIPSSHISVLSLFIRIGIENTVTLVSAVLTDHKIVFTSSSLNHLTEAAQALLALIYPFRYLHPFIPVLPASLIEVVATPTPCICGIHSDVKKDLPTSNDFILVDLDCGNVELGDELIKFREDNHTSSSLSSSTMNIPTTNQSNTNGGMMNTSNLDERLRHRHHHHRHLGASSPLNNINHGNVKTKSSSSTNSPNNHFSPILPFPSRLHSTLIRMLKYFLKPELDWADDAFVSDVLENSNLLKFNTINNFIRNTPIHNSSTNDEKCPNTNNNNSNINMFNSSTLTSLANIGGVTLVGTTGESVVSQRNTNYYRLFEMWRTAFQLDKQLRALFLRLYAELLSGYRDCLLVLRMEPKPIVMFHRPLFVCRKKILRNSFESHLLDSVAFQGFIQERGISYRYIDIFDDIISDINKQLLQENAMNLNDQNSFFKHYLDHISYIGEYLAFNEYPSIFGEYRSHINLDLDDNPNENENRSPKPTSFKSSLSIPLSSTSSTPFSSSSSSSAYLSIATTLATSSSNSLSVNCNQNSRNFHHHNHSSHIQTPSHLIDNNNSNNNNNNNNNHHHQQQNLSPYSLLTTNYRPKIPLPPARCHFRLYISPFPLLNEKRIERQMGRKMNYLQTNFQEFGTVTQTRSSFAILSRTIDNIKEESIKHHFWNVRYNVPSNCYLNVLFHNSHIVNMEILEQLLSPQFHDDNRRRIIDILDTNERKTNVSSTMMDCHSFISVLSYRSHLLRLIISNSLSLSPPKYSVELNTIPSSGIYFGTSYSTQKSIPVHAFYRRIDVLQDCIYSIAENRLSDARKCIGAVIRALDNPCLRLVLCSELRRVIKDRKIVRLERTQFLEIVRLMNEALRLTTVDDEYGVAYAILPLSAQFNHLICPSIVQFAYSQIQQHKIWKNIDFWITALVSDIQIAIRQMYLSPEQKETEVSDNQNWYDVGWCNNIQNDINNILREEQAKRIATEYLKMENNNINNDKENESNSKVFNYLKSMNQKTALQVAQDYLKDRKDDNEELINSKKEQEEMLIYSQIFHYCNRILSMLITDDLAKKFSVERNLQSGTNSTSAIFRQSNANTGKPFHSLNNGLYDVELFLQKFIDRSCDEANLTDEFRLKLHHNALTLAEMQIDAVLEVTQRLEQLPRIEKPQFKSNISMLPGEKKLVEQLKVYLVNSKDLHQKSINLSDNFEQINQPGPIGRLLPAHGLLYITNYRITFKGTPVDPLTTGFPIIKSIPLTCLLSEKKLTQSYVINLPQSTTSINESTGINLKLPVGLLLRSSTFECFHIYIDEEETSQSQLENFRKFLLRRSPIPVPSSSSSTIRTTTSHSHLPTKSPMIYGTYSYSLLHHYYLSLPQNIYNYSHYSTKSISSVKELKQQSNDTSTDQSSLKDNWNQLKNHENNNQSSRTLITKGTTQVIGTLLSNESMETHSDQSTINKRISSTMKSNRMTLNPSFKMEFDDKFDLNHLSPLFHLETRDDHLLNYNIVENFFRYMDGTFTSSSHHSSLKNTKSHKNKLKKLTTNTKLKFRRTVKGIWHGTTLTSTAATSQLTIKSNEFDKRRDSDLYSTNSHTTNDHSSKSNEYYEDASNHVDEIHEDEDDENNLHHHINNEDDDDDDEDEDDDEEDDDNLDELEENETDNGRKEMEKKNIKRNSSNLPDLNERLSNSTSADEHLYHTISSHKNKLDDDEIVTSSDHLGRAEFLDFLYIIRSFLINMDGYEDYLRMNLISNCLQTIPLPNFLIMMKGNESINSMTTSDEIFHLYHSHSTFEFLKKYEDHYLQMRLFDSRASTRSQKNLPTGKNLFDTKKTTFETLRNEGKHLINRANLLYRHTNLRMLKNEKQHHLQQQQQQENSTDEKNDDTEKKQQLRLRSITSGRNSSKILRKDFNNDSTMSNEKILQRQTSLTMSTRLSNKVLPTNILSPSILHSNLMGYDDLLNDLNENELEKCYTLLRLSWLNAKIDYQLTPTYSGGVIVPSLITDQQLRRISRLFKSRRFPFITWKHSTNNALLLRSGNIVVDGINRRLMNMGSAIGKQPNEYALSNMENRKYFEIISLISKFYWKKRKNKDCQFIPFSLSEILPLIELEDSTIQSHINGTSSSVASSSPTSYHQMLRFKESSGGIIKNDVDQIQSTFIIISDRQLPQQLISPLHFPNNTNSNHNGNQMTNKTDRLIPVDGKTIQVEKTHHQLPSNKNDQSSNFHGNNRLIVKSHIHRSQKDLTGKADNLTASTTKAIDLNNLSPLNRKKVDNCMTSTTNTINQMILNNHSFKKENPHSSHDQTHQNWQNICVDVPTPTEIKTCFKSMNKRITEQNMNNNATTSMNSSLGTPNCGLTTGIVPPQKNVTGDNLSPKSISTIDSRMMGMRQQSSLELNNIHGIYSDGKQRQSNRQMPPISSSHKCQIDYHNEWLWHISRILKISRLAACLQDYGLTVLISMFDGNDVVNVIISLVQCLLDPFYRTINGFRSLIMKEWISAGYKWTEKSGGYLSSTSPKNVTPWFLIFIDALHQILEQFPNEFQYSTEFLLFFSYHHQSGRFFDFLFNSEYERSISQLFWIYQHMTLLYNGSIPEKEFRRKSSNQITNSSISINHHNSQSNTCAGSHILQSLNESNQGRRQMNHLSEIRSISIQSPRDYDSNEDKHLQNFPMNNHLNSILTKRRGTQCYNESLVQCHERLKQLSIWSYIAHCLNHHSMMTNTIYFLNYNYLPSIIPSFSSLSLKDNSINTLEVSDISLAFIVPSCSLNVLEKFSYFYSTNRSYIVGSEYDLDVGLRELADFDNSSTLITHQTNDNNRDDHFPEQQHLIHHQQQHHHHNHQQQQQHHQNNMENSYQYEPIVKMKPIQSSLTHFEGKPLDGNNSKTNAHSFAPAIAEGELYDDLYNFNENEEEEDDEQIIEIDLCKIGKSFNCSSSPSENHQEKSSNHLNDDENRDKFNELFPNDCYEQLLEEFNKIDNNFDINIFASDDMKKLSEGNDELLLTANVGELTIIKPYNYIREQHNIGKYISISLMFYSFTKQMLNRYYSRSKSNDIYSKYFQLTHQIIESCLISEQKKMFNQFVNYRKYFQRYRQNLKTYIRMSNSKQLSLFLNRFSNRNQPVSTSTNFRQIFTNFSPSLQSIWMDIWNVSCLHISPVISFLLQSNTLKRNHVECHFKSYLETRKTEISLLENFSEELDNNFSLNDLKYNSSIIPQNGILSNNNINICQTINENNDQLIDRSMELIIQQTNTPSINEKSEKRLNSIGMSPLKKSSALMASVINKKLTSKILLPTPNHQLRKSQYSGRLSNDLIKIYEKNFHRFHFNDDVMKTSYHRSNRPYLLFTDNKVKDGNNSFTPFNEINKMIDQYSPLAKYSMPKITESKHTLISKKKHQSNLNLNRTMISAVNVPLFSIKVNNPISSSDVNASDEEMLKMKKKYDIGEWLLKKTSGKVISRWKRRWFELDRTKHEIRYYETPNDRSPRNSYALEHVLSVHWYQESSSYAHPLNSQTMNQNKKKQQYVNGRTDNETNYNNSNRITFSSATDDENSIENSKHPSVNSFSQTDEGTFVINLSFRSPLILCASNRTSALSWINMITSSIM